jgi:hypothetical protein
MLLFAMNNVAFARKKHPEAKRPAPVKAEPAAPSPPRGAVPTPPRPVQRASSVPDTPVHLPGRDVVQRESKIEFDERLVQGQTASGAIYLFQRGESEFNSMVRLPTTFRERTVENVLGDKR